MDVVSLATLLKQTLDPDHREQAEAKLSEAKKIIGFCPGILQVVMTNTVDSAVRQAGVIYFKNLVSQSWVAKEPSETNAVAVATGGAVNTDLTFTIHEQDKALVRDNIVQAVVQAPEVIRIQLSVCISMIIKHDFPHKWPQVVDQISIHLDTGPDNWLGALACLYQLVKNYEYKKKEERAPLNDAMNLLLPMIYRIFMGTIQDQSDKATEVKKVILKIYHALTQYILPLDLIPKESFVQWMEILRQVVEQEIPAEALTDDIDDEDKPSLIWWKQKKWALHILTRLFERYGSPGNVASEYKDFSEWYLKTFSQAILTSILRVLNAYRQNVYVSPRVMQLALNYVNTGVSHALTWKLIKPHILEIIEKIIFPLMSYTEKDAELWETDPYEYIRVKFDIFEDFVSPITAAQTVLHSVCKKRKDVLPKTMDLLLSIVQNPAHTPSQKDGALHMIGTMADILLKKKVYKERMEQFLVNIVFPEFNSPHGHLRARACWMLHYFADVKYKDPNVLGQSFQLTIDSLLKPDEEVPVKVEAAIALQMMLSSQGENTKAFVEPRIREITMELLKIIRETENDDLTTVMQKIVCSYTEQLIPVAVQMCTNLVETFAQVLEGSDNDEKAITAMGLLNTMETILTVMEDHADLHAQLEPVVLQAVHHIFTNSIMEFYEEAFSLTYDLTTTNISKNMWEMFKLIYQVFERDGQDYFVDMMPALHNYVTIDTGAFLTGGGTTREYPTMVFNMCKKMLLESDPGEDPECHAAKLLEVIILQCKDKHNIDDMIPHFIEVVFIRLSREIKTSELRTMCLQVGIAAMYYNHNLFFTTLQNSSIPGVQGSLIKHFIGQWLYDTDCFNGLHDRKLCVLGLCMLLKLLPQLPDIGEYVPKIYPSLIMLFDGLKRAYEAAKDDEDSDDDSDEDDEDDADQNILSSDEDEIDEESAVYLESLQDKLNKHCNGNLSMKTNLEDEEESDDEESEFDYDETALESFITPLDDEDTSPDEYQLFREITEGLQRENPQWYGRLTSDLTTENVKSIQEIFKLGQQRNEARRSKNIEQAGGYQFCQQSVPGQFNFAPTTDNFKFGGN